MLRKLVYLFVVVKAIVVATSAHLYAQEYKLKVVATPIDAKLISKYFLPLTASKNQAVELFDNIVLTLQKEGWLTASVDSIEVKTDTVYVYFYAGEKVNSLFLRFSPTDRPILQKAGLDNMLSKPQAVDVGQYLKIQQKIVRAGENNGYPFLSVKLDSITFLQNIHRSGYQHRDNQHKNNQQNVYAYMPIKKGVYIKFDTLLIKGDVEIKPKFLTNYLRLYKASAYSQQKINQAEKSLRQLPYLQLNNFPVVTFFNGKATVTLSLKNRKANQIDGIVGLLPNAEKQGKMLLTGQLDLKLYNLFNAGKNIALRWQRLKEESQLIDATYEHPNFFNTGIDVIGKLYLLREDTAFQNLKREIKLGYNTYRIGKINFSAQLNTTTVTRNSQTTVVTANTLPEVSATEYVAYGIGYELNTLDDIFYPKKGLVTKVNFAIGNKRILPSVALPDSVYRTLTLNTTQFTVDNEISYFYPIGKKVTILFRNRSGWVNNSNLFLNDLFRIGGINTLRGFNENEYFASVYAINTVEQRLFFEENSYTFLFIDQAYINNGVGVRAYTDFPYSFGLGFSFTTKAGVFSLAYALGNSQNQPLDTRFSKIHFGLTGKF
jgi:outer membrane translocation and assembly module TamA